MFLVPVVQVGSPRHGTGSIPAGRWVACAIGCLISPLRAYGVIPLSLLFSFASLLQPMLNFVFNSDLPKVFIVQSKDSRPLKVTMSSHKTHQCNAFSGLLLA